MNINFRRYREQQGMSQQEVASRLRISLDQVRHGEQFPAKVPMGLAIKWLQVLGVDLATAMSEETPPLQGIEPGFPYAELYRRLNLLNQYINETPPLDEFDFPTKPPLPNDVQRQIQDYYQKPNVVLTGGFDTGKSHLANSILGSKNLPESYQPATKLITIIRHLGNRPHWFNADVWIINEDFWLHEHCKPTDKDPKYTIDLKLLDDRKRCEKHRLYSGSFDILEKYGVHKYDNSKTEIGGHTAIVYLDSPLLKACNLIDLPGYSDQHDEISKDVEKANSATQIADILIVLGIGLAAGLASLIFGLFGEAWQSRLAKQIVKYFEEQDVSGKLLRGNKQYWQDTATAFDKGAEAVEAAWKENLEHWRELVSPETQSRERIEEIIKKLEVLRSFFAEIPWTLQGEG